MRLALVHKQFGGDGGLEKYLAGFAEQLLEAGHDLDVITARLAEPYPESPDLRIHPLDLTAVTRTMRLVQFDRRAAAKAAELGADLVLGFGQTVSQDVHRAGGGCHRVYSRDLPPWKRLSVKNRIELNLEHRLYTSGRTRRFVVNATKVADELVSESAVDRERISVIHTPVDLERFQPGEAVRSHVCPHSQSDRPAFVFVSLNHRRKGLDGLLEIWSEVDAELWIVGAPLEPRHARRIRSGNLASRVFHLGLRDDLPDVYRAADFFIHPTLYDACANTVLQAMASGLPSLVSSRDGAVDFIDDGASGLLLADPTDPQGILESVQRALSMSDSDRAQMSLDARERVAGQSWENHVAQWTTLLTGLLPE